MSRGGCGTDIPLVTDANRLPRAVARTGGQWHACPQFERVMAAVRVPAGRGRPRRRRQALAGDKGDGDPPVRAGPRRHGVRAVSPRRSDQRPGDGRGHLDRAAYRRRAGVEPCSGCRKENRAVGTRFDKLAVNFRATVRLATLRRHLRVLAAQPDPADRA